MIALRAATRGIALRRAMVNREVGMRRWRSTKGRADKNDVQNSRLPEPNNNTAVPPSTQTVKRKAKKSSKKSKKKLVKMTAEEFAAKTGVVVEKTRPRVGARIPQNEEEEEDVFNDADLDLVESDDESDAPVKGRGRRAPKASLKSFLFSDEDKRYSTEIATKTIEALRALENEQYTIVQATSVQAFLLATQAANARREASRQELSTAEMADLNKLLVALVSSLENTSPRKAAKLLPAAIAQFPFRSVYETMLELSWWGSADALLAVVERHLLKFEPKPPSLNEDLRRMLELTCDTGMLPPYPKDTLPLAFRLLNILREPVFEVRRKGWQVSETQKFNAVMRLCLRLYDLHGDETLIANVLALIHEVEDRGLSFTYRTWCNAMYAYGRLGKLDKVLEIFDDLLRAGVPPQTAVANTLMAMICDCGNLELAEQVLDNMRFRVPWKAGENYEQPLGNLLWNKTMGYNSRGFDDDPSEHALKAPVAAESDEAEKQVHVWPSPTASAYNRLMKAYLDRNNIDKVHSLYSDMKARNIKSDKATSSILSEAFVGSPYGIELLRLEHPDRVPPTTTFIEKGIDLVNASNLFEAQSARQKFSNKVDLHGLSRSQAKIVVMSFLDAIGAAVLDMDKKRQAAGLPQVHTKQEEAELDVQTNFLQEKNALIIVTGKGIGDEKSGRRGPILRRNIQAFLKSLDVEWLVTPQNTGRLYVPVSEIRKYALRKAQEETDLNVKKKKNMSFYITLAGLSSIALIPFFKNLPPL